MDIENLCGLDREARAKAYAEILNRACEHGFEGFHGSCFEAAVAINTVLFGQQGRLVAGLNDAFASIGVMVGHAAVLFDETCWDGDGEPKAVSEIRSWGKLDFDDGSWRSSADSLGFKLSKRGAARTRLMMFDNAEQMLAASDTGDNLADLEAALSTAFDDWRRQAAAVRP